MTTDPSNRTARREARPLLMRFVMAAFGFALLGAVSVAARPTLAADALWVPILGKIANPAPAIMLAQEEDTSSNPGASSEQIERYVAVYRAMQRNHSLTIEQAAATQGFTVATFRELEQRIERNSMSRESARRALAEPEPSKAATAAPAPKTRR